MDPDDGLEDDEPLFAWLPPDDRLWRHPSELQSSAPIHAGWPAALGGVLRAPLTKTWTIAVVAGVVGALVASTVSMATGGFGTHTTVVQPVTKVVTPNTVALATASELATTDWRPTVADTLSPSIVTLRPEGATGVQIGSGVLYSQQGGLAYVMTDAQLVTGIYDPRSIPVVFSDGQTRYGWLRGLDATAGVALVEVPGANRVIPPLGSIRTLKSAQAVMTVGSPLAGAATPGTVSSLDTEVDVTGGSPMLDMIGVAAPAASPYSSGGALVDQNGTVVGITTDVASSDPSQQGLSFAVPIDIAQHVARQILGGQKITHPFLGVTSAVDLSSATARSMGLTGGAQVEAVAPHSPAWFSGIAQNDVITQFQGTVVDSSADLTVLLASCPTPERVSIGFLHQGTPTTRWVTISEQPADLGS